MNAKANVTRLALAVLLGLNLSACTGGLEVVGPTNPQSSTAAEPSQEPPLLMRKSGELK